MVLRPGLEPREALPTYVGDMDIEVNKEENEYKIDNIKKSEAKREIWRTLLLRLRNLKTQKSDNIIDKNIVTAQSSPAKPSWVTL